MLGNSKSSKFFRMALWAATLAFVSVVFNAYGRLSEAGFGCTDWPGCYGMLFAPITAQELDTLSSAEEQMQLDKARAGQETTQRFISATLSLVLIRLCRLGWNLKKNKRSQQVLIPLTTLLVTFGLSAASFMTFEYRYRPVAQMMQIVGGMTILALLWWIVLREQRLFQSATATPFTRRIRLRVLFAITLVGLEILLGGWSMVNYAGLACPDFPTCQEAWWPSMDFVDAFTLWNNVGLSYEGRLLNLQAATAIHVGHRVVALMVLAYLGWFSLYLMRTGSQDMLGLYGLLLLAVLSLQIILGVVEVLAHLPLVIAVAHTAGAALLLMTLVTVYHVSKAPRISKSAAP